MVGIPSVKKIHSEEEGPLTPLETEGNYVKLPIPRLEITTLTSPKVLLGLVILSYLISAFLYMKVRALEEGAGVGGGVPVVVTTNASTVQDAFIDYATSLKLDTKKFAACLTTHKYAEIVTTDVTDGTTAGINATPGFSVNGTIIVGAQPFSAFKAIIDQELARSERESSFAFIPKAYAQLDTTTAPSPKVMLSNGHLPLMGKKNAKVTIIEFSDFQCPFCKQFFTETFPQIKKEYIDSGKVQFYFRHYPLTSIHPNAQLASEATECANEQKKFWEFHDILFTNQTSWANLPQSGSGTT